MKNMMLRIAFRLCLLSCTLVSAYAQSEDPGKPTIEIRTIGIPPYGIQNNGDAAGIYYDVANLLALEAGYTSNNLIYPYARIINELKTGQTDMTIMFKYPELEDYVTYIAPLQSLTTVVISLQGNAFDSIESLRGKTLAYLRGAEFSDVIDDDPGIKKQATDDFTQGLRMLKFGRVDAIIGPLAPILSALEGESELVIAEPFIVDERTPWVQVSNSSADRFSVERLSNIFQDIISRGELERIRSRYGELDD